jgi:hypothetical protein
MNVTVSTIITRSPRVTLCIVTVIMEGPTRDIIRLEDLL